MSTEQNPARSAVAIDYSGGNQTVLPASRGIYVGGAGNLKVDMEDGATVTFTGLLAGAVYPIKAKLIYQTGSTITNSLVLR